MFTPTHVDVHMHTQSMFILPSLHTHKNTHNSCFIHINAHPDIQPKHTTIPFTLKDPDKKTPKDL